MKNKGSHGWEMAWAGVGLIAAGCLLTWLLSLSETFGLQGWLYYGVVAILCVAYVIAIYIVVRRFFGKKK